MCDCLPVPISGVSMKRIQELSQKSGVNLISCTGFYIKSSIPVSFERKGEKFMQSWVERQLTEGDGSCDARPGFVKCAVSEIDGDHICRREWMAVRACAKAAKKFDMCLELHTSFTMPAELLLRTADMLKNEIGIAPDKVVFCHMDARNAGSMNPGAKINDYGMELDLPVQLLEQGFNIGLDTWSAQSDHRVHNDYYLSSRKKMLVELVGKGYVSQIVLGHDMVRKGNGIQNQCGGYVSFPDSLQELLKTGALNEADVQMLTVENPARILQVE